MEQGMAAEPMLSAEAMKISHVSRASHEAGETPEIHRFVESLAREVDALDGAVDVLIGRLAQGGVLRDTVPEQDSDLSIAARSVLGGQINGSSDRVLMIRRRIESALNRLEV